LTPASTSDKKSDTRNVSELKEEVDTLDDAEAGDDVEDKDDDGKEEVDVCVLAAVD
jgi:hypothetical protein